MNNIMVLTFHTIMNHDKNRNWSFLSTTIEVFENTLKYLNKNCYKSITLQELYDLRTEKRHDDSKLVLIHFDDGFLDNYTIAYPLLRKYGHRATVFVSPEFVDSRPIKRELLYDRIKKGEKFELDNCWGYMSWEELKEVDSSGVIDVQSHAMTHTWYPVEPKIVDIHHYGDRFYWLWWNEHISQKPFWLTRYNDNEDDIGSPIFKYAKSISSKRFFVNKSIIEYVKNRCKDDQNLHNKKKRQYLVEAINKEISKVYAENLGRYETDEEYTDRLIYEIKESKKVIEIKLEKKINFLAWPGGGRNPIAQSIAKEAGYYSVTYKGKAYNETTDDPFYVYRVGGWSGIKIFGKPSPVLEMLFIRMQFYRSKGKKNFFNRVFSSIGNLYRKIYFLKNQKKGEVRQ